MCLVGLGNPGSRYDSTRHNIGFDWIDSLSQNSEFGGGRIKFKEKFHSLWAEQSFNAMNVHLLKPQTYMNESGKAVSEWKSKNQGETRILVIYDEMDIPLGRLRLRFKGSDGGHRGLRSILERVPGVEIHRLRLGIGRPPASEAIDHVLEKFSPSEKKIVQKVLAESFDQFSIWLNEAGEAALNKMNSKVYGDELNGR